MSGALNPYGQAAQDAANMSTNDLAASLKYYLDNEASLPPDQHLKRGIQALEYQRRMQPASAQYNATDPQTGTTRPITQYPGYDPAGASQGSWNALISGHPLQSVGATPGSPGAPYDQTQAGWNQASNQPGGPGARVGYAPAMLHMEYDSTTGLPILNTPQGMAASHWSMGGPQAPLWQQGQTFGQPSPGVQVAQPQAAPQAGPGGQPRMTSPLAGWTPPNWTQPAPNALAQAGQPWWQGMLV